MFEKFTENAIKVIMHSREEAKRLEFGYVQLEHLLLGILHDKLGIAVLAMNKLGVDLKKTRRVVERLFGRGYTNTPLEHVSFDINVMEIISNAVTLAAKYGVNTVSPEHILLSLAKSNDSNIEKTFYELNISPDEIELEIKSLWQKNDLFSTDDMPIDLPESYSPKYLTKIAKSILEDTKYEAIKQGHNFIGTEQLLLSLTKFNCLSKYILNKFGVDERVLRIELYRLIGYGSGTVLDLLDFSSTSEKVLEYTWLDAKCFKYAKMGSGHLLAGLMTTTNSTSSYILKQLNIDPEQVRWETLYLLKRFPKTAEPNLTQEDVINELTATNLINGVEEEQEILDNLDDFNELQKLADDVQEEIDSNLEDDDF